jgi:hypothetical protein
MQSVELRMRIAEQRIGAGCGLAAAQAAVAHAKGRLIHLRDDVIPDLERGVIGIEKIGLPVNHRSLPENADVNDRLEAARDEFKWLPHHIRDLEDSHA